MTTSQEGSKPPVDKRSAFTYHGPPSGVTLGNGEEILLHTGATVNLPEEHEYTRTLLARKLITPEATATQTAVPAKPGKPATNPTKNRELT